MSFIDLQWFAPEDEGRTEQPSEHKLRKAREEGRLAKSQDLSSSVVFLAGCVLLLFLGPWVERKLEEMMIFFFQNAEASNVKNGQFAYIFARYFLMLVIPFAITGLVAGVIINLVQNKGFLFTTKTIQPKFDKIVPHFGQYFKRTLFSFQGVFNVAKSILKVIILLIVCFLMIYSQRDKLLSAENVPGPMLAMQNFAHTAGIMLIIASVILLGIGVLDYLVQRRQFREENKMTKQEVKQEFKELEGDPEVKSHLDSAQREMLSQNIPKAVREADVLITNPTHYAVALQWKKNVSVAPAVTAKGEDLMAQNMKRMARENDVPMIENRPLARGLYNDSKVGDVIPENYWRAIAVIYAQIGYMEKKN